VHIHKNTCIQQIGRSWGTAKSIVAS
jgi:hypothetical protein